MAKNKIDETFIKEQHTFTQHIRDPEHTPAPEGIELRRISIYTDLPPARRPPPARCYNY